MTRALGLILLLVSSGKVFAQTEITKPDQIVECLQSYIQQRLVLAEQVSWEHAPKYEFAGKYLHASWHSYPMLKYGIMYAPVGPQNEVYCDYPTDSNGIPMWENGFCKANVQSGNIQVEHTSFDSQGNEIKKPRNIGYIQNFKLFCYL